MITFETELNGGHMPMARIKVMGVGGAGCNAINSLLATSAYEHADFIAVNTDAQALRLSHAPMKLQLGSKSAKGLGAGANPEVGRRAAEEDLDQIVEFIRDADVLFLLGGLGGGTGSGALPVIARAAREMGILVVSVVTRPFDFEGKKRAGVAATALEQLRSAVDTMIVIPNQKLLTMTEKTISLVNAFELIHTVMNQFVKSIADIVTRPGQINVDFADLKAIMKNMGMAVMGTGRGMGENRARQAAEEAVASPLLENMSIQGAHGVLLNITGGSDLGLHEVHEVASIIHDQADKDANIILGWVLDETLGDAINVTVIATGFDRPAVEVNAAPQQIEAPAPQKQYTQPVTRAVENVRVEAIRAENVGGDELDVPAILRRSQTHVQQ